MWNILFFRIFSLNLYKLRDWSTTKKKDYIVDVLVERKPEQENQNLIVFIQEMQGFFSAPFMSTPVAG